jgi:hypothetical protein
VYSEGVQDWVAPSLSSIELKNPGTSVPTEGAIAGMK